MPRRCSAPDGAWEVLQFANAELVGERTYELSRFLRGQAGSEWAMAAPLPAGAPFVLLDEHVVPIARGLDLLGTADATAHRRRRSRPWRSRGGRAHRDAGATALKPLAPVHLRARRTGDGVTFCLDPPHPPRRRRAGSVEVPLGEESEAYELDVLSGTTVKRTLASDAPSMLYAAADELADFGAAQTSLSVRLAQMSATVGRGFAQPQRSTPEMP